MSIVNSKKYNSVINQEIIEEIKIQFDKLDTEKDLIVPFNELVTDLEDNEKIQKFKDETVFFIKPLEINITLEHILNFLMEESKDRVIDKYISYREFESYFKVLRQKIMHYASTKGKKDAVMEIDSKYLRVIKDVFDAIPREINDFVKKEYFIEAALNDIQVQSILDQIGRRFKEGSRIIKETILQVLYRIRAEAKEFINWRDICSYFSEQTTLGEYSKKETYWKNIAENQLIDEAGTVNKHLDAKAGVSLVNQPTKARFDEQLVTRGEVDYFESMKFKGKSVRFKDQGKVFNAEDVIDTRMYDTEYVMSNLVDKVTEKNFGKKKKKQNKYQKRGSSSSKMSFGGSTKARKRGNSLIHSKPFKVSKTEKKISKEKKKLLKRYWDKQITIPKGPKMMDRKKKKETIKERKMREYLEKKRQEEEYHIKKKFKAKEVPMSSKTPMFMNMMVGQEEQRRMNKEKLKQKTLKTQKPFSFADKDAENYKKKYYNEGEVNPECDIGFRANHVPEFYAQPDSLEFLEAKRKKDAEERLRKRQEKWKKKAKMPSRMQEDEKKKEEKAAKIEKMRKEMFEENCTFKPVIKKKVPDLDKEYEDFQLQLEEKKNMFESTRIEPFELKAKGKQKKIKEVEEGEEEVAEDKKVKVKKKFDSINKFLERNFLPTEKKKEEARKEKARKDKRKLKELEMMSENKGLNKDKLKKKIVELKVFEEEKEENEPVGIEGANPMFQFAAGEEGVQSMGLPKPKPKKNNFLFKPKKKTKNSSKISTVSFKKDPKEAVTKAQKLIQEKKEEEFKLKKRSERKNNRKERKRKKKEEEAKKKVRERFPDDGDKRNLDEEVKKMKEEFKNKDTEYQVNINKVKDKVDQKMLLVERRGHTSKIMTYYRRLMSSELGLSIKKSSNASQARSNHTNRSQQISEVQSYNEEEYNNEFEVESFEET